MTNGDASKPTDERQAGETVDEARRAALQRMGKYAAYTAPTLLVLLGFGRASAQQSDPGNPIPVSIPCDRTNPPPECG